MKKALCLVFLAVLAVAGRSEAQPPAGEQPLVQPAAPDSLLSLGLSTPQAAPKASLPSCGAYDGLACTTPGERFRCQWIPTEPGRCVCTAALVWQCG